MPGIRTQRLFRTVVVGAAFCALACDRQAPDAGMTEDAFVEVMVGLRRAALTHANDPDAFRTARDELLARTGTTDSMLHRFAAVHARDPERLADVFAAIRDSLRTPASTSVQ